MAVRQSSTLFSQLLNTGLQQKDNPLYQVIYNLIGDLVKIQAINTNTVEVIAGLTFLPGSIIYAGADGRITQDNANLFYDYTNKRLGIGTTDPAQTLVAQSAGSGNVVLELKRTGGTTGDWLIGLVPLSDRLSFFSGSERASLTTAGVFSISSLIASGVIEIGTTPATTGTIRIPNNTVGVAARNAANTGNIGIFTVNASDEIVFGLTGSGDILFNPGNTEQFRALTSVGLRLVAAAALFWNGRGVLTSPADAQITFQNNANTSGFGLQMGTADTLVVANKAQNAFGAVRALKYRAEAAGNFEFNGRTLIACSADGFLEITVNSAATGFGIQAGTDTMVIANKAQNAYGTVDAKYKAQGTAGVATFGPSAVASITIKDGIVTAIS